MLLNLAGYLTLAYFGACLVLFVVLCLWDRIALRRERIEPEPVEPAQTYCPACLCIAHEHELDTADSGHPMLCDTHLQRLSRWLIFDMHTASEARKRIRLYPAPLPIEQ